MRPLFADLLATATTIEVPWSGSGHESGATLPRLRSVARPAVPTQRRPVHDEDVSGPTGLPRTQ
jgi:hypothetical protein